MACAISVSVIRFHVLVTPISCFGDTVSCFGDTLLGEIRNVKESFTLPSKSPKAQNDRFRPDVIVTASKLRKTE